MCAFNAICRFIHDQWGHLLDGDYMLSLTDEDWLAYAQAIGDYTGTNLSDLFALFPVLIYSIFFLFLLLYSILLHSIL